jgi:hypothetical protein
MTASIIGCVARSVDRSRHVSSQCSSHGLREETRAGVRAKFNVPISGLTIGTSARAARRATERSSRGSGGLLQRRRAQSAAARELVTEAFLEIAATGIENRRVARVADVPRLHRLAVGPLRVLFIASPADSSEPTTLIVLRIVDRAQLGPAIDSARRTRVTRRPASGSD